MREIKYLADYNGDTIEIKTKPLSALRKGSKGRFKQQGYMMIRVIDHPKQNKRGYISEHRLIMESSLGRILSDDEIIHHKNHIRDDNRIENLELMTDQKRHAAAHAASMDRDVCAKTWKADAALSGKKFRLLNKNTGLMEVKNLSQLINTTYRKSQFEYRGEFTGLLDKNGAEIYEGDILKAEQGFIVSVEWSKSCPAFSAMATNGFPTLLSDIYVLAKRFDIIGNIHENPELLTPDIE